MARGVERMVLLSARDWAVSGDAELHAGERALQSDLVTSTIVVNAQ